MKNFFLLMLFLLGSTLSHSQEINSYKYVIVPQEFDFLKEKDQYQLNSLTKFLFEKEGFVVFFEGEELTAEFPTNPCEALVAEVENNSGLFRTRVNVILKDCFNKQVFISEEGVSRKKDFKEAYHEALRNAFESVEELNYSYNETIISGRPNVARETESLNTTEDGTGITENVQNPVSVKPTEEFVQQKNTSDSEKIFSRDDSRFFLKRTAKGYNLYQEGMDEPFAALVRSNSGENFIYSAINSQGMAHIDEKGNLIVEILNSETGTIDSTEYKFQP